ncbi:MAG: peptidoglycan-binding protein LysM [Pseudomonadota bacterium]|jgi:nucleoid-associated protein YgaU
MGLFDFARNIGKKIFGSEEEAPDALKAHVEQNNPGVENLQVQVQDGVATVSGNAQSPEALEKAVLMVGNAMGIQEVKADNMTVAGTPVQEASVAVEDDQYYIIQKGDTLWKIAERAYGNGALYNKVFEVNREVIEDPDKIFVGQKIRIPK